MKIKECKKTVNGAPFRYYANYGGGRYPVHGAYWKKNRWKSNFWEKKGYFYSQYHPSGLDLDLAGCKE